MFLSSDFSLGITLSRARQKGIRMKSSSSLQLSKKLSWVSAYNRQECKTKWMYLITLLNNEVHVSMGSCSYSMSYDLMSAIIYSTDVPYNTNDRVNKKHYHLFRGNHEKIWKQFLGSWTHFEVEETLKFVTLLASLLTVYFFGWCEAFDFPLSYCRRGYELTGTIWRYQEITLWAGSWHSHRE